MRGSSATSFRCLSPHTSDLTPHPQFAMDAPSLQELQQWMKSRIATGRSPAAEEMSILNPQGGAPGTARLAVYGEGYVVRIREALAEVFEAVRHLLGSTEFAVLAADYAKRHPSTDYNLSLAGRHLPEYLADSVHGRRLPFLSDLACLEWAISQAFHAFDQPPLDPARLASLPLDAWARARLVFQPSVAVVSSSWPIVDLWEARTVPRERIGIDLVDRPQRALITRHGEHVRCERVDPSQAQLLTGLLSGRALGEVCAELEASDEPPPVAAWFSTWAGHGLLVCVDIE